MLVLQRAVCEMMPNPCRGHWLAGQICAAPFLPARQSPVPGGWCSKLPHFKYGKETLTRACLWESQSRKRVDYHACIWGLAHEQATVSHLKMQRSCGITVSECRPVIVLRFKEWESAEVIELPLKRRMETPLCSSCLAYLNRNTIPFPPAVHLGASWTLNCSFPYCKE